MENAVANIMAKVIGDHVIELPTVKSIEYEKGLEIFEKNFGKYGCTAVGKQLENGDMIVGRSMDLHYSNRPGYIIRSEIPGFYRNIGVVYNSLSGAFFEDVVKNGVSDEDYLMLYCVTLDVLNEKGLYIEGNMRDYQPRYTGIKECSGTNPGAKYRISYSCLARFLGDRAASVKEAIALFDEIDVYGMKREGMNWGGGIFMADASGDCGVLEVVDNKVVWSEKQPAQTNFYLHPDYRNKAVIGAGMGRYDVVMKGRENVKSEKDMMDLMHKVRYTQFLDPDHAQFDPRGELPCRMGKVYFTMKDAMAEENREAVYGYLRKHGEEERAKTLQQLRDENTTWLSTYQLVANCNKKTIHVTFFEDDSLTYDISL